MINTEYIEKKINNNDPLNKSDIMFLIKSLKTDKKEWIYSLADNIRRKYMGDEIYIRGIIEFSNICRKSCMYCGIRNLNLKTERYRMSEDEIIETCKDIEKNGQTTVVLQSGEDMYYSKEKTGKIIKKIKNETDLAVTLSLGERDIDTYQHWHQSGMDRYLLRFETSNKKIFKNIHPDDDFNYRITCIKNLKKISVQTGSGFMIGLPNTYDEDIANDILLCYNLDLDMIGIGPYIPHPDTPLNRTINFNINFLTGIISILRIVNKDAHIPATTAFDAVHSNGRQLALDRGANIFMPNATPKKYRENYYLYPNKPCVDETSNECANCVNNKILNIGRKIGKGPGHSIHKSIKII